MALTPEDVVNKRFQPTKFREGYDQDEVDDFLDEVVVELRRLNQENEELRQRLVAADARINQLQAAPQPAVAAPSFIEQAPAPTPEPVAAAPAVVPFPAADTGSVDPSNTNNLLQLARRLHEEHVREGVEKRDALIAEGHATAARVVADAEPSSASSSTRSTRSAPRSSTASRSCAPSSASTARSSGATSRASSRTSTPRTCSRPVPRQRSVLGQPSSRSRRTPVRWRRRTTRPRR